MPPKKTAPPPAVRAPKSQGESAKGKPLGRTLHPKSRRNDGKDDVTVPADGRPGNTRADQEWIERHRGELEEIPDDELEAMPFGVRLRWEGQAPQLAMEFLVEDDERRQCTGRSYVRDHEGRRIVDSNRQVLTRPCRKPPIVGSIVCASHGGLSEANQNAAKRRLMIMSDAAAARLVWIALHPDTVEEAAIKAINSILDRAGIRAGVDLSVRTPEWQEMLREMWEQKA